MLLLAKMNKISLSVFLPQFLLYFWTVGISKRAKLPVLHMASEWGLSVATFPFPQVASRLWVLPESVSPHMYWVGRRFVANPKRPFFEIRIQTGITSGVGEYLLASGIPPLLGRGRWSFDLWGIGAKPTRVHDVLCRGPYGCWGNLKGAQMKDWKILILL